MLTQAAQIQKFEAAFVGVAGFASAGGTSETFTSALSSALTTAGNGGVAVPLQATSAGLSEGVIAATPFNKCVVYSTATQKPLQDANGNDVYARITLSGSTWTLNYFSMPGGTETAYTMVAATNIDLSIPYVFTFDHKPYFAGIGQAERHVGPDAALFNWREFSEPLTVTGTNTLSALTNTPDGRKVQLYVNHLIYSLSDADQPFASSGKTVTWSATNAGFSLQTGYVVTAVYTY